jgi:hypothetical protein
VVEVRRKNDRILSIKIMIGGEIATVISAYALQVGFDNSVKQQFWEDLDEMEKSVPCTEKFFIGGDLNGYVGPERIGFESVYGDQGFGNRNILNFAVAYDSTITKIWFKKKDSHLVIFKSGLNASQIDFFIMKNRF